MYRAAALTKGFHIWSWLIETNGCNMGLKNGYHMLATYGCLCMWRKLVLQHVRSLKYEYMFCVRACVCVCTGMWFVCHCLIERKSRKRFPFHQVLFTSPTSHAQQSYCIRKYTHAHAHTDEGKHQSLRHCSSSSRLEHRT